MKQKHRATSSKYESLAREMRERALLIEGNPTLTVRELQGIRLRREKEKQLAKVEAMKKLYFNAGRWAGGARDHIAREAFEQINFRDFK